MKAARYIDLGRVESTHAVFRGGLDVILRSNVLLQANSGGGKSWALRRMIEQSFGRVPQIVIDPEGEFSTLRQNFDLVLVGKGGDTPADVRSAQLLAHRLLELGISAVVDLFEMSKSQRPVWVATFVQALVDAPKKLWRDLLLYVDEAHELAPEAGHGAHESNAEKTCRHALIDFAAKGRKRGYGVVAATQRLGKLSKDFAAELKNVLIGQTFIDIDRERAAGSLGIAKADKAKFFADVKTLSPGSFYSLGRAFTLEPTLVKIGSVQTEHPEAGRKQSLPPPPTEKIRHLLPQLADLPKEAEEKLKTEKELRARVVELEREVIKAAERHVEVVGKVEMIRNIKAAPELPPLFSPSVLSRLDKVLAELAVGEARFVSKVAELDRRRKVADDEFAKRIVAEGDKLGKLQQSVVASLDHFEEFGARYTANLTKFKSVPAPEPVERKIPEQKKAATPSSPAWNQAAAPTNGESKPLTKCARALLSVIVQRGVATSSQVSALSGYRKTSSSLDTGLSELRVKGLIVGSGKRLTPTEAGMELIGKPEPLPSGRGLLDYWVGQLTKSEGKMLQVIYEAKTIDRQSLSNESGYPMTSSSFDTALSGLRVLELIHGPRGGDISIADIFNEGSPLL